jgi:hypothetical protein
VNQIVRSNTSAKLAFGSAMAFLFVLAALHRLEPEFNPPHLISEYELGRFGWLMSLAFFALGAASLALAHALWSQPTRGSRPAVLLWLVLIGIAYFCAGILPPDPAPPDQIARVENFLHAIAGTVVIFSSPIVFTLLWVGFRQSRLSPDDQRLIGRLTTVVWLSTFAFIAGGFAGLTSAVVGGWMNRFMIATYCAWLSAAAWALSKAESVPTYQEV